MMIGKGSSDAGSLFPGLRSVPSSSTAAASSSSSSEKNSPPRLASLYVGKNNSVIPSTSSSSLSSNEISINQSISRSSSPSRPTLSQFIAQTDPDGKYGTSFPHRDISNSSLRKNSQKLFTTHYSSSSSTKNGTGKSSITMDDLLASKPQPIYVQDDFFSKEGDDTPSLRSSTENIIRTNIPSATINDDFFSKETDYEKNTDESGNDSEESTFKKRRKEGSSSPMHHHQRDSLPKTAANTSIHHVDPPIHRTHEEEIIILTDDSDDTSESDISPIFVSKSIALPTSITYPSHSTSTPTNRQSSPGSAKKRLRTIPSSDSSNSPINHTESPSLSTNHNTTKEYSPPTDVSPLVYQGVSSRAAAVVEAAARTVQNLPDRKRGMVVVLPVERKESIAQQPPPKSNKNEKDLHTSTVPSTFSTTGSWNKRSLSSTSAHSSPVETIRHLPKETSVPLRSLIAEVRGPSRTVSSKVPSSIHTNSNNSTSSSRPLPFNPPVWSSSSSLPSSYSVHHPGSNNTPNNDDGYIAVPMRPIDLMTHRAVEQERLLAETASNQQLQMELELDRQRRLFMNRTNSNSNDSYAHSHSSTSRTNSSASGSNRANSSSSLPGSTYGLPPSFRRTSSNSSSSVGGGGGNSTNTVPTVQDNELTLDLAIALALGSDNYYEQLGLGSYRYNADTNESIIKKRYHTLARLLHPDKVKAHIQHLQQQSSASPSRQKRLNNLVHLSKDRDIAKLAEDAFKQVAEAYKILTSS